MAGQSTRRQTEYRLDASTRPESKSLPSITFGNPALPGCPSNRTACANRRGFLLPRVIDNGPAPVVEPVNYEDRRKQ